MKSRNFLLSWIIILPICFSGLNAPIIHAQPTPGVQCSDPTIEVEIRSLAGIRFDLNQIQVPKATCVKITLINENPDIEHDFTIDGITGNIGIEEVYIPVTPSTTNSFNVTTPDADVTLNFYCSVPGHRAAGEEGDFIVGEGTPEAPMTSLEETSNDLQSSEESSDESSDESSEESASVRIQGYNFYISFLSISILAITLKRKIDK